jgi:hypothetical protein
MQDDEETKLIEILKETRRIHEGAIYDVQMYRIKNLIRSLVYGNFNVEANDSFINVSKIKFEYSVQTSLWRLTYLHNTNFYSDENYKLEEDEEEDEEIIKIPNGDNIDKCVTRATTVCVQGEKKKYDIYTCTNSTNSSNEQHSNFNIYVNSQGNIRIKLIDTQVTDLEAHIKYIGAQINNYDMPEYFALRVLTALSYNQWNSEHMCMLLDVVSIT